MILADGPAPALLIALLVLGLVALLAVSAFLVQRRARRDLTAPSSTEATTTTEAPPEAPPPPAVPPAAAPRAPPDASVDELIVEAPPSIPPPGAPAPSLPPVAPEPTAPEPVAPEGEAPPTEAPTVETPDAPPIVEARAPKVRKRARPIGALRRIFGGSALTQAEWDDLEEALLRADVGVAATDRIVTAMRARKDLRDGLGALREELLATLAGPDRALIRKPGGLTVWLVTGVNGAGKTTTIGKLASQLRDQGASVVLAAADTFRAAADQQLEAWADRAGAQIVKHAPGADPAAVVFDGIAAAKARNADVLIVDTAGRLQNKRNLMEELEKIHRVLEREAGAPDETLLVLDATTGQNGLQQARAFTEAAKLTGIILSKLDGSAKGGIVIGVQQELGIPVKMVGLGESIEDLAAFDPETFVDDLLAPEEA